jgi:hypothetical protein
MGEFKHVRLDVIVAGTTPSGTLNVQGCPIIDGTYTSEVDANASKTITASTSYLVQNVARFVKLNVPSWTGTGVTFEVHATPYN